MAIVAAAKNKINTHSKLVALGLSLLIIGLIVGGVLVTSSSHNTESTIAQADTGANLANKAYLNGDKAQAIKYSKQVLADDPSNISNTMWLASMVQAQDPSAAKHYYAQALTQFEKVSGLDASGKPPATYWAAAKLALQAGEISQARHYYQEVITAANAPGSSQASFAPRAQAMLRELQ